MLKIEVDRILDSADVMVAAQNYEKALLLYSQIIDDDNNCDEAYLLRGELLGKLGQVDKAFDDVLKAISIDPSYDFAHMVLASLYKTQGDIEKAITACQQAIALNIENLEARNLIAQLYDAMADKQLSCHQPDAAVESYRLAVEAAPENIYLLYKHAFAVTRTGKFYKALELVELILAKKSDHVPTRNLLVSIYEKIGELDKGWEIISSLAEEFPEAPQTVITYGKYALRNKQQVLAIAKLMHVLRQPSSNTDDQLSMHMLLGKLYDSISDFKNAFIHFSKANKLKYNDYDIESFKQQVSAATDYFSSEKYNGLAASGNTSEECIFILGMPRSGTSLIEQIVSAHSKVYGGGELQNVVNLTSSMQSGNSQYPQLLDGLSSKNLDGYANELIGAMKSLSPESPIITDKLPHNFLFIGLIHKLLPKAKIINCLRNPVDNCLSCYFQHFGGYHPYAYDLSNLAEYYQQYIKLMDHWENALQIPILNVQYENVVQDTRVEVERILRYLKLDWEDRCLEFHKQSRVINTASYTQVNQEIYTSALDRWKNYKPYIGELNIFFR